MTAAAKRLQTEAVNLVRRMLEALDAGHYEDAELVYEKGGGWYQDIHQIPGRIAWYLLRRALIRREAWEGGMEHYLPAPEARVFVRNPDALTLEVAMRADAARREKAE